jgi:hypothetical protein
MEACVLKIVKMELMKTPTLENARNVMLNAQQVTDPCPQIVSAACQEDILKVLLVLLNVQLENMKIPPHGNVIHATNLVELVKVPEVKLAQLANLVASLTTTNVSLNAQLAHLPIHNSVSASIVTKHAKVALTKPLKLVLLAMLEDSCMTNNA